MRDRAEHDRPRLPQRLGNGVGRESFGACAEPEPPLAGDIAEREGRRRLAGECMELEPEYATAEREAFPLAWADAREQGRARSESCGRRGRVQRGPAQAPVRLALEFVSCDVSDRDEVEHHTLKRTWTTSPSFVG